MNRATSATGWVRNPALKLPDLDPTQASSYELGWTWNPITGCLNHTPEGLCLGGLFPCYAYRLAHGRLEERYLANRVIGVLGGRYGTPGQAYSDPFYPRLWQSRLNEPLYGNPKGIFVCDMGELFGDWLPDGWANEVFHTINRSPQHRFYLLTKQPQNLPQWSPFPDNCWVGVTVTNADAYEPAINALAEIEAKIRYISFEPLLENPNDFAEQWSEGLPIVDWVIIGAQTKPYKPPEIAWVEEIIRACDKAGVKVFLKDNLAPIMAKLKLLKVTDGQGLPRVRGDYTLRQEIPK